MPLPDLGLHVVVHATVLGGALEICQEGVSFVDSWEERVVLQLHEQAAHDTYTRVGWWCRAVTAWGVNGELERETTLFGDSHPRKGATKVLVHSGEALVKNERDSITAITPVQQLGQRLRTPGTTDLLVKSLSRVSMNGFGELGQGD